MNILANLQNFAMSWRKPQGPQKGRMIWDGLIAEDPNNLEANTWLAAIEVANGDFEKAEPFLRQTVAINKQSVEHVIAGYEWLEENHGIVEAERYLDGFIAARDAAIFQEIDAYVKYLTTTDYVKVPLDVQIETFTKCNAACTFCQYPELTRIGDKMPDELFDKIISDLREFPTDLQTSLTLYGVNEPFLDKRIWKFMRIISDELPHMPIALNTNGAPLTEKTIDSLTDYNIARLSVSFNDHRKAFYEETMKINYERTVDVLNIFERKKAAGIISFPVGVTRAGDGSIEDLRFIDWVNKHFPSLSNNYTPKFEWVDDDSLKSNIGSFSVGCTHWFDMAIRASGHVSFCCIDGHNAWPKGNVKTESLLEIYNKPEYRRLRGESVKRPDVEQCKTCRSG